MENPLVVVSIGIAVGIAVAAMIAWAVVRVTRTELDRARLQNEQLRAQLVEFRVAMPLAQRRELEQVRRGVAALQAEVLDDTVPKFESLNPWG